MTDCPFCPHRGSREEVHLHLVDGHADRVEAWTEADSGHMHYRVACPHCGDAYEHRIKPRSHDPSFLGAFAREIRMVGFDMLLNHVEAAHGADVPAEGAAEGTSLPESGPGGGRGRPGAGGLPVPPGMEAADPPHPWKKER